MNDIATENLHNGLLAGRRFLVTGGAQGIGAAIVRCLAAAGASGAVIDLHADRGEPGPWPIVAADVTDEALMAATLGDLAQEYGPFDGLVAAAGIVPPWEQPSEVTIDTLNRTLQVNLNGYVIAQKILAPLMGPGSTVVAIASLNAWRGDANLLSYAASKHAVLGAVRSSALALGVQGIRVNAVAPGPVATAALLSRIDDRAGATGMDRAAAIEASAGLTALGRVATADDVANAVLFLSSPLSNAVTGQLLPVDGGLL